MPFRREWLKRPLALVFSRDGHGDFTAARGDCGRGRLAHQLAAVRGPPAVTPASAGEKPGAPVVHEPALNKSPQSFEQLRVASVKARSGAALELQAPYDPFAFNAGHLGASPGSLRGPCPMAAGGFRPPRSALGILGRGGCQVNRRPSAWGSRVPAKETVSEQSRPRVSRWGGRAHV